MPVCDEWTLIDNKDLNPGLIAKYDSFGKMIVDEKTWKTMLSKQKYGKR